MKKKPIYFDLIHNKTVERWKQLEQDPELAGPWHQLFNQIQSPRHVLSELLQNADDAGATEASALIEDNVFSFRHNGFEFTEDNFASLCRFGYSNKKTLHTIGFRGIGFKSLFSLGNCVELFTPTLAISFDRKRFTVPHWIIKENDSQGKTWIRVVISDINRKNEVEKNFEEWLQNPLSLLFFKNIRKLQIGNREVHWHILDDGPIRNSNWMTLSLKEPNSLLLIHSEEETFPDNVLNEIRQERMLNVEEENEFPPCKIDIILGANGKLFVILPTGIETELPFACNAPFIQDPARLKIKEPEISPTNRWLLERVGKLAASAMLDWLSQTGLSISERAKAYSLLPDFKIDNNSIEGVCNSIVKASFLKTIDAQPLLLTEEGMLTIKKESIIIPKPLFEIWPTKISEKIFDDKDRPALCQHVKVKDCNKLIRWGIVEEIDKKKILNTLSSKTIPKPESLHNILNLWEFVTPDMLSYWPYIEIENIKIIPVQGEKYLQKAKDVVRLSSTKQLQSEDDWKLLTKNLLLLDQSWPVFLAEQERIAKENNNISNQKIIKGANDILKKFNLDSTSNVNKVIDLVSACIFSNKNSKLSDMVRLAQIAAKLKADIGSSFRFVTEDGNLRSINYNILFDLDGSLTTIIPEKWRLEHFIHSDYTKFFTSCSSAEWLNWILSGRSKIQVLPLIEEQINDFDTSDKLEIALKNLGYDYEISYYPYQTKRYYYSQVYRIIDFDFPRELKAYWQTQSDNPAIWRTIAHLLLKMPKSFWIDKEYLKAMQSSTNGISFKNIGISEFESAWLRKLRQEDCLPDTHGFYYKPEVLLRRTNETDYLIGIESFIENSLDNKETQPLLDLLNVQKKPAGPERILDCLRALSKAVEPPVHEVEKLYNRLDQMVNSCSAADFQKIEQAFKTEKLFLADNFKWTNFPIFLSSDSGNVPGIALILPSVKGLTFWKKIGVAEKPTVDLVIKWLKEIPSNQELSEDTFSRVLSMLSHYPVQIWNECKHWPNLMNEWANTNELLYALSSKSFKWFHLDNWVKQKTANLQFLPLEVAWNKPFSNIPSLDKLVKERFLREPVATGPADRRDWLTTIGNELSRVDLNNEEDTKHTRILAQRLKKTSWLTTSEINIIPYIDETPAGIPKKTDVLWMDYMLYINNLPKAKLAKRVPEEIGKSFGIKEIKAALDYSFERSPSDIQEYMKENFNIIPYNFTNELKNDGVEMDLGIKDTIPSSFSLNSHQPLVSNETGMAYQEWPKPNERDNHLVQKDIVEDDEKHSSVINIKDKSTSQITEPYKPNIIQRFALAQGFIKDNNNDRFFHSDGFWINRSKDTRFPWELRKVTGELVRFFWPKEHCLELEPLKLEADIWWMLDKHPETYSLILSNIDGNPLEVTGANLRNLCNKGKINIYPDSYRLVYKNKT